MRTPSALVAFAVVLACIQGASAQEWKAVDLDLFGAGKLPRVHVGKSDYSWGCPKDQSAEWRRKEFETGNYSRTYESLAWARVEAKRAGAFFLKEFAKWWGLSTEEATVVQSHRMWDGSQPFSVSDRMGDGGKTTDVSSAYLGTASPYLFGCRDDLRATHFYPVLGHEAGHLMLNLVNKARNPKLEDWVEYTVFGLTGEFVARVTELIVADALEIEVPYSRAKDFDEDDEHKSFVAAECWYATVGKQAKSEERYAMLEKILRLQKESSKTKEAFYEELARPCTSRTSGGAL